MKIALTLNTTTVTGGGKCILKTAQELRERGHDVKVYLKAYSWRYFLRTRIFPETVHWAEIPHRITVVRDWSDIPEQDVLIATAWRTAKPVANWARKHPKATVAYYVQHNEALWDGGQEAAHTYDLDLKMIVISTWLKDMLKQEHQKDSLLLVTPVDEDLFNCVSENQQRSKRVMMLHHTFDWKCVEDGYQAFEILKDKHPEAQLVLLGGRVENPQIPENAKYHYKPSASEINELYASCGIFLCPSEYEGLGMPAMEAMATKSILVTTDNGGCRDYALHEKTALLSAPKDIEALAQNLIKAYESNDNLETMRNNAQEQIKKFTWSQNISKLEEYLK